MLELDQTNRPTDKMVRLDATVTQAKTNNSFDLYFTMGSLQLEKPNGQRISEIFKTISFPASFKLVV